MAISATALSPIAALRKQTRFRGIDDDKLLSKQVEGNHESKTEETPEDMKAEHWAQAMINRGNGCGKKTLRETMKATIEQMCTSEKPTAILEAIKNAPADDFDRGQKVHTVLNVSLAV